MLSDLTGQQSISTGTGSMALNNLNGYDTFNSAFGVGPSFFYMISNTVSFDWETGIGILSNAATLVRQTVIDSSNNGSLVNFPAGIKNISNDLPSLYQNQLVNPPFRSVVAGGTIPVVPLDGTVWLNPTVSANQTVTVNPAILIPGRIYIVADSKGIASTFPITITPSSGLFRGNSTFVMNFNYQSAQFSTDGVNFI